MNRPTRAVLAFGASLLCACSLIPAPYQDKVGSVEVAVQSVAHFQDYVDGLQPQFKLTAADALDAVAPVTQLREIERLRALALSVKASFSGPGADAKVPDAPTPPESPSATLPAPTPWAAADAKSLAIEPMLRYRAAASLYQEVILLSSSVRDAAIRRGTQPYIVRILVTVFPRTRKAAFDAYATVTFLANPQPDATPVVLDRSFSSIPVEEQLIYRAITADIPSPTGGKPVEVIPLFVTDSLESSARSFSDSSSLDLSLSAAGGLGTTALGGGANAKKKDADRALGRVVSGTQTIGRVSDNTLEIRMGASFLDDSFALVPRTYNVTALLLLPTANQIWKRHASYVTSGQAPILATAFRLVGEYDPGDVDAELRSRLSKVLPFPAITYHAAAGFVSADRGRQARTRRATYLEERVGRTLRRGGSDLKASDVAVKVKGGDTGALAATLGPMHAYLLPLLLKYRIDAGFSLGSFTVPELRFAFFQAKDIQDALVRDDGKDVAKLTIAGATRLSSGGDLSGILCVEWKNGSTTNIRSEKADLAADGRSAILTFPSLEIGRPKCPSSPPDSLASGDARPTPKAPGRPVGSSLLKVQQGSSSQEAAVEPCRILSSKLSLSYRPPLSPWDDSPRTRIVLSDVPVRHGPPEKKTDPPKLALVVPSTRIFVSKDGTGQLAVEIRESESDVGKLSVAGADILEVVGQVSQKGADRIVKGGQTLLLKLGNLVPPGAVTVGLMTLASPAAPATGSPRTVEIAMPPASSTKDSTTASK